ncbi:hypothetical protein BIV57_16215 [Mangrovactinospora gilvigrisea]|uniref:HTH araC/xylS-type domain-containing protein n=1 Tax=Mangrovactinospora gilvigrisea TaxID=1428644 RepID=A0A1J7C9Z4_9ACTN|nr:AraC family transcriptional regulator [Mangrovactinospora gilvigrisea]OIV36466.1 hypothetical protein BIV57_16215 [Mangrovactinospora gilvigrisea]
MPAAEHARHWPHPHAAGVDLLSARYVRHTFARHVHATYTVGAIVLGVEEFYYQGSQVRVGPGGLALVNPGTVHTGHAGIPEGWAYHALYPPVPLMREVAADLVPRGAGARPVPVPLLTSPDPYDPATARAVLLAHRAASEGDRLAADTLLRAALAQLLLRHGTFPTGADDPPRAGAEPRTVREAAALLDARLTDPPGLAELAELVGGGSPFTLLRAFRRVHGLPPHAWLVQRRVDRARALLDAGTPPADAAAACGFADQAHLTRHFRRTHGVAPGAYQRMRRRVSPAAPPPDRPARTAEGRGELRD